MVCKQVTSKRAELSSFSVGVMDLFTKVDGPPHEADVKGGGRVAAQAL
jgi:hypothetical protein